MPWLLPSPGHQQPWHWLYKINWALSSKKKGYQYLCHLSVDKWEKMQLYIFVFQKNIQPTKFNDSTVESEKFVNQRNSYVLSQWRHKLTYTEDIPPNWWHTMDMLWEKFQWIQPLYTKSISFQSKASVVCSITAAVFIDYCLKKLNVFSQHIGQKTNEYLNSTEQIPRNWNVDQLSMLITS